MKRTYELQRYRTGKGMTSCPNLSHIRLINIRPNPFGFCERYPDGKASIVGWLLYNGKRSFTVILERYLTFVRPVVYISLILHEFFLYSKLSCVYCPYILNVPHKEFQIAPKQNRFCYKCCPVKGKDRKGITGIGAPKNYRAKLANASCRTARSGPCGVSRKNHPRCAPVFFPKTLPYRKR